MSKIGQIVYQAQEFASEYSNLNISDYEALAREKLDQYAVEAAIAEYHKIYEEWTDYVDSTEEK